ncbi:hypothetical protein OHA79_05775 [Streptomyces sp. NBC_00841]|uniref:hypothetical protein n=1 Tax=Streptomyces sp. NBC_00841 TaxID=2975847 RepID=UPI002DDA6304|nr:hypothetical protein [Streptomyces sp. NBC_00841]WRZ97418.1 hypothetical protein OHA79_05775 [Streptomyces sp. NBC_00841]
MTSCGGELQQAESAGTGAPRVDAARKSDQGIRRDKKLVREYFPELGDFEAVVWKGEILGDARSVVPGPSDFQVSGVVHLGDGDAARLRRDYAWKSEPGTPVVLSDIRPEVPKGADWQTSEDFTLNITDDHYAATFYADFDRKIVVFDARNPERHKTP